MLKLSKLSKVFLIAGLLLAFSCATISLNVAAVENEAGSVKECEARKKADINKCTGKNQDRKECELTAEQNYNTCINNFLSGSLSQTTIQKTSTQVTTMDNSGAMTKTVTGSKTVNDKGQKYDEKNAGEWEKANKARNDAQDAYTKANVAYNKCLAGGGDCNAEKEALNSKKTELTEAQDNYNTAQKNASDAYNAQAKADRDLAKAEARLAKADDKAIKKAEKALKKCKEKKGEENCSAEKSALENAKNTKESHALKSQDEATEAAANSNAAANKEKDLNKLENNLKREVERTNLALKQAEADCERYSAMTSNDAQAKAQEACAKAAQLEQEVRNLTNQYNAVVEENNSGSVSKAVENASKHLRPIKADYNTKEGEGDTGVVDIRAGGRRLYGIDAKGNAVGTSDKTGAGYVFNYNTGADTLETITRRAALVIVGLKPIVYVFAGFGLIAFAWMAIFGKLSWKWFANIAMGLFLVANMGRFIEYFVTDGGNSHHYIGTWKDGHKGQKAGADKLASAFHDIYFVYGDTSYNPKGLRNYISEGETEVVTNVDTFKPDARGFCKGTSASRWANFTSCMGDIVSSAKKVASAVKKTKATVDDVRDRAKRVEDIVRKGGAIDTALKGMKGGSLTDIIANTGTILNSTNNIVSTTTGAVGSLTNAASNISNDVQEVGKSTDQQRELADRRATGEATNAFDAKIKGQEFNKTTGEVEKVDGKYAGQETWVTKTKDVANDIKNKSGVVNNMAQEGLAATGAVTNVIENTSLEEVTFGLSRNKKTLNSINESKKEEKAQARIKNENERNRKVYENQLVENAEKQTLKRTEELLEYEQKQADIAEKTVARQAEQQYQKSMDETNNLYQQMNNQKKEAEELAAEAKRRSDEAKKSCSSPNSSVCQTAKASAEAAKEAAENMQKQAKQSEADYNKSKEATEKAYQATVEANIKQANNDRNTAEAQLKAAEETINDVNTKIDEAKEDATATEQAYDNAKTEAAAAKDAYDKTVAEAKENPRRQDQGEIERLKNEYEAKLKAMADANDKYREASSKYQSLEKQKADAQKAYNEAYTKIDNASQRLATYTNESVNKTGESKLSSSEDVYNNQLVNQYTRETNPVAVAQASKNKYVGYKNTSDLAEQILNEKRANLEGLKVAYEAAKIKAKNTGAESDLKYEEKMKKMYALAEEEVKTAEKEYKAAKAEKDAYIGTYIDNAVSAEKYKQQVYQTRMKQASDEINTYERQTATLREQADKLATNYMRDKSAASSGNTEKVKKAAESYDKYKDAKEAYEKAVQNLENARQKYQNNEKSYQQSVAEQQRLEDVKKSRQY
ncbi:MAG: hypothetical protein MJ210_01180 [Alphaproteobacteria bacterium]|nr:hypothetical protein [Alphaproteobacteria bacterium]